MSDISDTTTRIEGVRKGISREVVNKWMILKRKEKADQKRK